VTAIFKAFGDDSIVVGFETKDRFEAIAKAGSLLVQAGQASHTYSQRMAEALHNFGPYMVVVEGVALAHAAPDLDVISTGMSLVSLAQPVDFGGGKMVSLVFALAAIDHHQHIDLMGEFARLFEREGSVNLLLKAGSSAQLRQTMSALLGE